MVETQKKVEERGSGKVKRSRETLKEGDKEQKAEVQEDIHHGGQV